MTPPLRERLSAQFGVGRSMRSMSLARKGTFVVTDREELVEVAPHQLLRVGASLLAYRASSTLDCVATLSARCSFTSKRR